MTTAPQKKLLSNDLSFRLHCLNRDNANLSLLKYNDFQGFLVTGQHSGTHWIKWMMSHAMAHHYQVPPPKYYDNRSSNDIIGHPKHARMHPQLPRIASSHAIPPTPMQWAWVRRWRNLPPYVLVVRDMRDVLVSNYEKWKHRYNVSFAEYLEGDPWSQKYITDVWNYTRFMNRWGEVITRSQPGEIVVLKYEDVKKDTAAALKKIAAQFKLPLGAESIAAGVAAGHKDFMARHRDPEEEAEALRPDGKGDTAFTPELEARLREILSRNLKHDFGYPFFDKPRGFQG